ncbi:MAG TPA: valine--tRNA ligase [Chloroflexota bacterium]|nr:valine--tRNA ligase [Chloroflexota bacterium]
MTELADLTKAYDAKAVEARTYAFWEGQGYFTPKPDHSKKPFTIMIPPPNVTGALHTGHALTFTIEDILVRWHRMLGDPTLWLPGTDHAAIATNYLLQQQLAREGISWQALGREKFLERAWQWKEEYHARIVNQMKRLGMSVDWSRERFTMDEGLSRAVRTVFVRLYQEGLIYRGEYMVNWCPGCQTVISDLEVAHREENGELWTFRYPLADDPKQGIEVDTTRPETMLGDTAVAVHPEDDRYRPWIGKTLRLPLVGRLIPVVADEVVDPKFGTGAVKVTPAHDPTDYEIGKRHSLPAVEVMHADGTMSQQAGKFAGLDRFEARQEVLAELEAAGALVKTEPYSHAVGHCQRSDDVVEPRISEQWFVRMKPLAEPALQAVLDGRITIIPDRFTKVYTHWLEDIRDWAISRQIWWGHRVPVWYCQSCDEIIVQVEAPSRCPKCRGDDLLQDPDTLDTWFSSGLWPISTLGWPDDTEDLRYFYPTSVMETGYDILFFWVARMAMLGLHFMDEVPFRQVYLHGMVRDAFGQKMSKTKGNVIDPLDLMDEYGTDALRLAMVTGNSAGNDLRLSEQRVEHGRNVANKIWQAARFALSYEASGVRRQASAEGLELPERWIRSRALTACRNVTRQLEQLQLGEAARTVEEFFWGEFCDWYLESAKPRVLGTKHAARGPAAKETLREVLAVSVRLLHPFMPYVTEEIWQHLRQSQPGLTETIAVAQWPGTSEGQPIGSETPLEAWDDAPAEADMALVIEAVTAIRNYRSENKIDPRKQMLFAVESGDRKDVLLQQAYLIEALANVALRQDAPSEAVRLLVNGHELRLSAPLDVSAEQRRLNEARDEAEQEMIRASRQLDQPGFRDRAPAHVVEKAEERLTAAKERLAKIETQLRELG